MIKLKSVKFKNYCGYRDTIFDFVGEDGRVKPIAMFYGPNGAGKSNLLNAANMLGQAHRYTNKDTGLLFRKLTFHPDYNPTYAGFQIASDPMEVHGVFRYVDRNGNASDRSVIITTEGVIKNELPLKNPTMGPSDHCYFIDSDKESERRKFLLHEEKACEFKDLAEIIYGYKVELGREVSDLYNTDVGFYTDFTIQKESGVKVHFKRMSDGERKIAKMITSLCNPIYMDNIDILLIDNIDMHVYFKRHIQMLREILSRFPDKQFLVTTHSGVIIEFTNKKYQYDIEIYKADEARRLGQVVLPEMGACDQFVVAPGADRLVNLSNEIDPEIEDE